MMTAREDSAHSRWLTTLFKGRARWLVLGLAVAAAGVVTAAVVTRSGGGFKEVTIPAGTRVTAVLQHTISTEHGRVGERVELQTVAPLTISQGVALAPGILIRGEVTATKGGGRIAGAPSLTIRFRSMEVDGKEYPISAEPFRIRGKNDAKESAAEIGGGAVVGGIVGAVAGNTLKGAAVGAVLGTGVAVATKGNQIVLPVGQKLRIRLTEPVTVSVKSVTARR
jgi:hypothetical protein